MRADDIRPYGQAMICQIIAIVEDTSASKSAVGRRHPTPPQGTNEPLNGIENAVRRDRVIPPYGGIRIGGYPRPLRNDALYAGG